MFDFFLNPAYLAVGGALVSAPIIIHLINRMRFKRIRWAAMEFLLKSQKRNRRRLIIEQLLLLLLRCILVLLVMLLVARFIGFTLGELFQTQTNLHVIVLDDSPSMSDHWTHEGERRDSFNLSKDLITRRILQAAERTPSAQRLVLLKLSQTASRAFDDRYNEQSKSTLLAELDRLTCGHTRVELLKGIEAARTIFDETPEARRFLHIVTDFRQRDWATEDTSALTRALEGLKVAGVQVRLIDAAHPFRNEFARVPPFHDNLGIVELRPETRVAAKDMPVEFTCTVQNFSSSEKTNVRVTIKVNGIDRAEGSFTLQSVPPGTKSEKFQIAFDQEKFNLITANLEPEESGLHMDNTLYAVVEVRKQVPVLVVDGDPTASVKPGGDLHHLQTLFSSAKGYQIITRGLSELEQPNLDQYPSIYLLNVREVSDKAVKNLETYVKEGGGLAIFLGPRVNPRFYTDKLYADGKGLFPAPLADRPNPSLSDPENEAPDLLDGSMKLFLRNETHPVTAEIWKVRSYLKFLPVRRYWPVPRRQWKLEAGQVQELATLPNTRSVREYAGEAKSLMDELSQFAARRENEKYRPGLERWQKVIRETLADQPLNQLGLAVELLLRDRGEANEPQRPNLVEFWDQAAVRDLRIRLDKFRETVQFGDPLVIARQFGRGRVVAFLTTLGSAPHPQGWHNWAGGSMAAPTFPIIMLDLQKHLTGVAADNTRILGKPVEISVDSTRFTQEMRCFFLAESPDPAKPSAPEDQGVRRGDVSGGRVSFLFENANRPGVYLFELTQLPDENNPAGPPRVEQRAFVYTIDPEEGELRRATRDDIDRASGGLTIEHSDSEAPDSFTWQNSLSESPWFFVIFLLVLVLEQALAVHLSYHVKGSEAPAPTPAPAPTT